MAVVSTLAGPQELLPDQAEVVDYFEEVVVVAQRLLHPLRIHSRLSWDAQRSGAPSGTSRSGCTKTTSPSATITPSVSTSEKKSAIWRGGKFTTASTSFPSKSAFW